MYLIGLDRLLSWLYITRLWGSRCLGYDEKCWCCQKWHEHDELFG